MTEPLQTWGIDPGLSGAIAMHSPVCVNVFDIPTHEIATNGKKRRKLDLHALNIIVQRYAPACRICIIEDVHAMPKQGVSSSFSFGFTAGAIQAVVAANNIPYRLVTPQAWKKHFGLNADKDAARRMASQRLPNHAATWARVKDDGRAEAALIALYGAEIGLQVAA